LSFPRSEIVSNSYTVLIHDERNSPLPYEATKWPPESAVTAYELLKGELLFYMWNHQERSDKPPTDEELQLEACRIIYGSDVLSRKDPATSPCWLRDLLLSSEDLALKAKLSPIRRQNESRVYFLKINGKDNIFEDDPMERQLHEHVKSRTVLGLTAIDNELQVAACNILGRAEESSSDPSELIANFLVRLVFRSSDWLAPFRQRAALPRSEDIIDVNSRSRDPTTIDSTIHNYTRLEAELAEFVKAKRSAGVLPTDAELQRQARIIVFEYDDNWNQTAADNPVWLAAFKERHLQLSNPDTPMDNTPLTLEPACLYPLHQSSGTASPSTTLSLTAAASASTCGGGGGTSANPAVRLPAFFLNDANCYRRLTRELARWVGSTMSPNNPSCHIPTDEELQHQARWILYDS
jgi:hypothetical protein